MDVVMAVGVVVVFMGLCDAVFVVVVNLGST